MKQAYSLLLRENKSQGLAECFSITALFSFSLYLHFGDCSVLCRCFLAFLIINLNLWDLSKSNSAILKFLNKIQQSYWVLLPVLCAIGIYLSRNLLFSCLEVIIYYQILEGMPKIFTAGEIFLNSHILISLFQFSCSSFSTESLVMYFSVLSLFLKKIVVQTIYWILYTLLFCFANFGESRF